jgi:exodeoxyribonuclease VII small subunit
MEEKQETLSFEQKLQFVQDLADRIESGKLSLEDSVRQYEQGMKILGELDQELQDMNRRLTVLRDGKETELNDPDL